MLDPIPCCLTNKRPEEQEPSNSCEVCAPQNQRNPVTVPITVQPRRHSAPVLPSSYSASDISESPKRRMQEIAFSSSTESDGLSESYKRLMRDTDPELIPIKWGLGNQALFGIDDSDDEDDFMEPGKTWMDRDATSWNHDGGRSEVLLEGQGGDQYVRLSTDLYDLLDEEGLDIGLSKRTEDGAKEQASRAK